MRPVPAWFRWLAYLMAALLALCVVLQYNDPDPIRWMAFYGAAMVISVILPARRAAVPPAVLVALVALAWSGYLVYDTWGLIEPSDLTSKMSEKGGAVEAGREAGGLAITGAWLLAAALFRNRRA